MPQKLPWEPMSDYQEFPTFATQDDAAKVNAPGARNYVATEDGKHWFDPNPNDGKDGKFTFDLAGVQHVFYPRVFVGRWAEDNSGVLTSLVMPVAQAAKVNIIPTGPGSTNWASTGKVAPVPLMPFAAAQKLLKRDPFSPFMVRNTDVPTEVEAGQQTTVDMVGSLARIEAGVNQIKAKFNIT